MGEANKDEKAFIVDFWCYIFHILSFISIFKLIRLIKDKKGKKISYLFVEIWVASHCTLSLLAPILCVMLPHKYISLVLSIYGLVRSFEIIVYQINVLLFAPYKASKENTEYTIKSSTRMVIMLLHNAFEFIGWYTLLYVTFDIWNNHALKAIYLYFIKSFSIFAQLDISILSDTSNNIILLVGIAEIICGLFMTLLCLARFLGLLPSISSRDNN